MDIKTLWNSNDKVVWESALSKYYESVKSDNNSVEEKLNGLTTDYFMSMSGQDFYRFLVGDYAQWKYTDGRIKHRVQHEIEDFHQFHTDNEFKRVIDSIFGLSPDDIYLHIANISRISGIGSAGASGILSLIFPQYFGTVDRYAAENLQKVYDKSTYYGRKIHNINPTDISTYDAVTLIEIYREKANELNTTFGCDDWTPRKIDMILWGIR